MVLIQIPPRVRVAFSSVKATLVTPSLLPLPHLSQTIPSPFPPTPRHFPGGRPRARLSPGRCALPWGAHVLHEAEPHRESASQKRGQRTQGSVVSCLLCLTALFVAKVNGIVQLCTVMKQRNEGAISQALYVADELLQMCCAHPVTLTLPWLQGTPRPVTFSALGRRGGAEGTKGVRIRETVY